MWGVREARSCTPGPQGAGLARTRAWPSEGRHGVEESGFQGSQASASLGEAQRRGWEAKAPLSLALGEIKNHTGS